MGPEPQIANCNPGIVVVDNFLKNAKEHRNYALGLEYEQKKSVGLRSKIPNDSVAYKAAFEQLLQRRITFWPDDINGCYQWCKAGDSLVYHVDDLSHAGVIYLTPDAPLNAGTSFWRSKNSGLMEFRPWNKEQGDLTFGAQNKHIKDPDQWELVDQVASVYNRLVLWSSKKIHSATSYFGDRPDNARLFQVFFFDCR